MKRKTKNRIAIAVAVAMLTTVLIPYAILLGWKLLWALGIVAVIMTATGFFAAWMSWPADDEK